MKWYFIITTNNSQLLSHFIANELIYYHYWTFHSEANFCIIILGESRKFNQNKWDAEHICICNKTPLLNPKTLEITIETKWCLNLNLTMLYFVGLWDNVLHFSNETYYVYIGQRFRLYISSYSVHILVLKRIIMNRIYTIMQNMRLYRMLDS